MLDIAATIVGAFDVQGFAAQQCNRFGFYFARDGLYSICEPPFDGVACLWFDSPDAARAAMDSDQHKNINVKDLPNFLEMKYLHVFLMKEHWTIGPIGAD